MPDTNPMPFPDCSVVTHSNVVMTPSTLTFDISESEDSGSVCDDPFFLKEVMTFLDYFKREYISHWSKKTYNSCVSYVSYSIRHIGRMAVFGLSRL